MNGISHTREGSVNLDSARHGQIETLCSERQNPSPSGKGEKEDRFGKIAASPNSQNLPARGIDEVVIHGISICRGIAIGKPFFYVMSEDEVPHYPIAETEINAEISRYHRALSLSMEDIQRLQHQLRIEQIIEGVDILDAHLQMIQDPLLTNRVEEGIRSEKKNAESVFHGCISEFEKMFASLTNVFFQERFQDVRDISRRVMSYLRNTERLSIADIPPNSIVFARELTASDAAEADLDTVSAFVTELGGTTSHTAIVSKAKGIPYISSVDIAAIEFDKNALVIVDGFTGSIILNPSEQTIRYYQHAKEECVKQQQSLEQMALLNTETYDGYSIRLSANIEMTNELDLLHLYRGSGVGLFRSEYIVLSKGQFPTEEEQFEIYSNLVQQMNGLPIVIRTFDLGGDKVAANHAHAFQENNPFLGCRAIRFLLKQPEIFKTQLKAILRASVHGDVSIMFPMISGLPELMEAKRLIAEARAELLSQGIEIDSHPRIGCMIEVPSAAITADLLAKECDFLSIGTNDLVQYALAVDRDNQAMGGLYSPAHPSVLRLIKHIVNEAHHCGIPVSVCGEIAADPLFTALLLGLGIQELSVSLRYLPTVRNTIRNISIIHAIELAEEALSLSTAHEVQQFLIQKVTGQQNDHSPEVESLR
jgi:phosphotransferase system enzyme I (PtsI)